MSRAVKALFVVAAVVATLVLLTRTIANLTSRDATPPPRADAGPKAVATPSVELPAEGLYVISTVKADGTVAVQTRLRSPRPISELRLTTTDPDLLPGSVEALDVLVRGTDGTLLAHRRSVGTNSQLIRLRNPTAALYFTYSIDGAMDDATSTVPGRSLARVLGMDVDYDGADGTDVVVRRLVTAPGTVLNVACLRPSADLKATPRPCGQPTGDGDWLVDLKGADRSDRLLAQLEG